MSCNGCESADLLLPQLAELSHELLRLRLPTLLSAAGLSSSLSKLMQIAASCVGATAATSARLTRCGRGLPRVAGGASWRSAFQSDRPQDERLLLHAAATAKVTSKVGNSSEHSCANCCAD